MQPEGIALVTGASRGLGRAIALELATRGFEVVATMRDPEAGDDLPRRAAASGGTLSVARLDVTRPETIQLPEGLRVLVNNAGIDEAYLPIEHTPLSQWRSMFETNFFGMVEVTRRAIPLLRESEGGVICNVSSCAYLTPVPLFSVYRASKAAVGSLGESLRAELAPFGIRVVEVLPGPIDTDMLEASDRLPEGARHPGYREFAEGLLAGRRASGAFTVTPEAAASKVVDAILDDRSPLRNACDPLGEGQLQGWRENSDETWMRRMLGIASD